MMSLATPLETAIAHSGYLLASGPGLVPAVPRRDPLSIELPPAVGGAISAGTLTTVGALYLFAEVEMAGVLVTAEALVEARDQLSLRDARSAEALDRFALDARTFPTRPERESLYARLFGIGGRATLESSGHHTFITDLAAVCLGIVRVSEGVCLPHATGGYTVAALRYAIDQLLSGLATHAGADITWRARRIHDMLVRALELLSLEGIQSSFGVHGVAQVVHAVMGDTAQDVPAADRRGRAGQRILAFAARGLGSGSDDATWVREICAQPDYVHHAATWLAESAAERPNGGAA